jgi:hypothetical protein
LDEAAHEGTRRLIAEGTPATGVGTWCDAPSAAVPLQKFLDERLADPKEGGEGPLRAEPLITGAENLLSKVERIGFHGLEHNALSPYKQSRTAINT